MAPAVRVALGGAVVALAVRVALGGAVAALAVRVALGGAVAVLAAPAVRVIAAIGREATAATSSRTRNNSTSA